MRFKTCLLLLSLLLVFTTSYSWNTKNVYAPTQRLVPSQYPTIQAAIFASGVGDTIVVSADTYYENVEVNQTVNIIGAGKYTTKIDARGRGAVIEIMATGVYISGFSIINGGSNAAIDIQPFVNDKGQTIYPNGKFDDNIIANSSTGVYVYGCNSNTVVNNIFLNNSIAAVDSILSSNGNFSLNTISGSSFGIRVLYGTANSIVRNTMIDGTTSNSIHVYSSTSNTISYNNIVSRYRGIYLERSTTNANNNITRNIIKNSPEGITLGGSNSTSITHNTLSKNVYGIRVATIIGPGYSLLRSASNTIKNNNITQNDYGIELYSVKQNTFIGNWLSKNTNGVWITYPQGGNTFYYNNFLGSTGWQAYQPAMETWSDGLGKGNYWSEYPGYDRYYDASNNNIWDVGEPAVKDVDHSGIYTAGDVVLVGTTPPTGGVLRMPGTQDKLHDKNGNYVWDVGEPAVRDVDNSGTYTAGDVVLVGTAPSIGVFLRFPPGRDTNGDGVGDTPPWPADGYDTHPLMSPWSERDVAVISVTPSTNSVLAGSIVDITVEVKNVGKITPPQSETFTVTARYNSNIIETQQVNNLAQGANQILTFNWNTLGVAPGDYIIKAEASIVPDELNNLNNILIDGSVTIIGLPDLTVKSVTPSRAIAYAGYGIIYINVNIENEGITSATSTVTAYQNSTEIETQAVTLAPGAHTTLIFTWDISTVSPGYYNISATVEPALSEIDLTDNSLAYGLIHIRIPGDTDGNGRVSIVDLSLVSAHWYPGPPEGPLGYDESIDIDDDGTINMQEVAIVSANWSL